MADEEDLDHPPASDDAVVQNYLETNWREAIRGATESMAAIRRIYPEMTQHLPEKATRNHKRALEDQETAVRALLDIGPLVLGQEVFDEYIEARTRHQINSR